MKKYLVSITYCQDIESVEVEANSAEEAEKIEQAEIEVVELGEALLRVADAGKKLLESGLTERAVVVLLHDYTGVSKTEIKVILNALPNLGDYTK